jgi:hypothetical protein
MAKAFDVQYKRASGQRLDSAFNRALKAPELHLKSTLVWPLNMTDTQIMYIYLLLP